MSHVCAFIGNIDIGYIQMSWGDVPWVVIISTPSIVISWCGINREELTQYVGLLRSKWARPPIQTPPLWYALNQAHFWACKLSNSYTYYYVACLLAVCRWSKSCVIYKYEITLPNSHYYFSCEASLVNISPLLKASFTKWIIQPTSRTHCKSRFPSCSYKYQSEWLIFPHRKAFSILS